MEIQMTQNSQNNLEKKNKFGELTLPGFKIYYKATSKHVWHKDRHINQYNRIKSLEINSYTYGQLIFDKDAKTNK